MWAIALCAAAPAQRDLPVYLTDTKEARPGIIYEGRHTSLARRAKTTDRDFASLYAIQTPDGLPDYLKHHPGTVLYAPEEFAVARLRPEQAAILSQHLHASGFACGGITRLTGMPMVNVAPPTPRPMLPVATKDTDIALLLSEIDPDRIQASVEELAKLPNRFHSSRTGQEVPETIADWYAALAGQRSDIEIETYSHGTDTAQDSVRITIPGTDRRDEVLILGSHIDSVNWYSLAPARASAPGADDNASGTATNLEIFRVLMDSGLRLRRTLEIHGYAAEEVGLVGSIDMAEDYRRDQVNVVAMVQHDMNLFAPPDGRMWFIRDNTHAGFNQQLTELVETYLDVPTGIASLGGGSSDHEAWRRQGYAAAFPFEDPNNHNSRIHTAGDTIAYSGDFEHAANFARLGLAFALHFGGVDADP